MLNSKTILNAMAALAIVTAVVPLSAGKAEAYACMNVYAYSTGITNSETSAKIEATKKWSASVKGKLDMTWAVWNIAKNKSFDCQKKRIRGKRSKSTYYKCIAKAKPCQYVVN